MARALTALCALVLAAACSSEAPAPGRARLDVQVFGDPAELAAYGELVDAFADRHPGIDVRVVPVPDQSDHYAKLTASFASGSAPDVFVANFRNFPRFAAAGVIEPPGDRLRGELAPEAFFDQPVEAFTWKGNVLCVPQNVSSLVVYYNADAFAAAGIDPPRRRWTYGEFHSAAVRLTTPDRHGVAMDGRLIRLAPLVWSNGGEVADAGGFRLDTPQARQAILAFVELGRSPATPTEEELEATDAETRFIRGQAAMVLGSRRSTTTFRTIDDFTWDVADLPRLDQPASILHSDAYCVARDSDHRDEAFELVTFAAGPVGQPILTRTGRIVPSRRDVARSEAFFDGRPPASAEVFVDAIPHLRRTPPLSTWPEIEHEADAILEEAFFEIEAPGAQPTDEVQPILDALEARTRHLFEEAESG